MDFSELALCLGSVCLFFFDLRLPDLKADFDAGTNVFFLCVNPIFPSDRPIFSFVLFPDVPLLRLSFVSDILPF